METYLYKVFNTEGAMEEGTIGASSGGDAANALRLRGFSIISLTKEASEKKERRSFLKRKPFSRDETLSVLASEWSALLKAGLTITATLALLEEQAKKHEKPILSRARETVMEGRTLWETLDESGAFPRFFTALIQVGEMTGTLPEELDRIAEHYRKKAEFKRKAVSALAYPCFVLLFALTVLLTILTFILPTFETLFASLQITLPAGARIALAAGKFLQETGRFLFLLPLLSALGLGISLKTEKGREKIDEILYRSRFCKRLLLIRFAATLSAFLESGRTLGDALEDCKDTIGNREAERALEAVKEEVTKGNDFAESLKKSGFSLPIFYQLTRIGMESGELPDFLMKAAGLMEREAERKASRFRAILEPAMLLLVGGMTAIVVFSVILPVFHMAARV